MKLGVLFGFIGLSALAAGPSAGPFPTYNPMPTNTIAIGTTTFSSLTNAISAAYTSLGNCTITLGPGTYNLVNGFITLPTNTVVTGAGVDATVISGSTDGVHCLFELANDTTIQNLTIRVTNAGFAFPIGTIGDGSSGGWIDPTRWVIRNIRVAGGRSDNFFFSGSGSSAVVTGFVQNCSFEGNWDLIAMFTTAAQIKWQGCKFEAKDLFGNAGHAANCVNMGVSAGGANCVMWFIGSDFYAETNTSANLRQGNIVKADATSVFTNYFIGCNFKTTDTNDFRLASSSQVLYFYGSNFSPTRTNGAGSCITYSLDGIASQKNIATTSTSITFPATTVNWTNTQLFNIVLYIDNSGVTGTVTKKNGQQVYSTLVGDVVLLLKPGDYFSETYTVGTPTGRWEPQ